MVNATETHRAFKFLRAEKKDASLTQKKGGLYKRRGQHFHICNDMKHRFLLMLLEGTIIKIELFPEQIKHVHVKPFHTTVTTTCFLLDSCYRNNLLKRRIRKYVQIEYSFDALNHPGT